MAEINSQDGNEEEAKMSSYIYNSKQRREYFDKLESWLIEAYTWQTFMAYVPYAITSSHDNIGVVLNSTTSNNEERPNDRIYQRVVNEHVAADFGVSGITYKIPPLWKRFVAELIDTLLLFLLKLSLTFIAVDIFDIIDIKRYYMDILESNLRVVDYKMALDFTSGLMLLEFIHKIFVCIFEASWLQHGRNGHIGGATPGKSIMKLKVVRCNRLTPVGRPEEDLVRVVPGTDLGILPALGRSVLKNLVLAFFFPICFVLYFFKFNRTGYDLVCNSIVVEDTYRNGNNNNNNDENFNNNNNNNYFNNNNVRPHQN